MRLSYVMAIIDMEPSFPAAAHRATIEGIQRELKKAIADGAGILFIESTGERTTLSCLQQLVENYEFVGFERKSQSDGCWAVLGGLRRLDWQCNLFVFCGVNSNVCVLQTVLSLAHFEPDAQVEVVQDACNAADDPKSWSWSWFRGKNIRLRQGDNAPVACDPFMPGDLRKFIYTGFPF